MIISIHNINKGAVLAALYNYIPREWFLVSAPKMTEQEADQYLVGKRKVGYVKGRSIQVDLGGQEIDSWLYDHEQGPQAAKKALSGLMA